jgi:succinyl-diaminopimelate desuccinylase
MVRLTIALESGSLLRLGYSILRYMTTKTSSIDILSTLGAMVAIPSWKSSRTHAPEADVVTYCEDLISRTCPWLQVRREAVSDGRDNLFITDGTPTSLLVCGHVDVMPPGTGWTHRSTGEQVGDRFYGRGAMDTKGGIASLLSAVCESGPTRGMGYLLYCDEEYDFAGMRAFVAARSKDFAPEIAFAIEPSGLTIQNGCRGLAEFRIVIRGTSAHAARQQDGVHAFDVFRNAVDALKTYTASLKHEAFGVSTVNVAALRCGQFVSRDEIEGVRLNELGNVTPDYAEGVIEVRTTPGLGLESCIEVFTGAVRERGARVEGLERKFDLQSFYTEPSMLGALEAAFVASSLDIAYRDISRAGYSDIEFISRNFGAHAVEIGPSGDGYHGPDEYVELKSLQKLKEVFLELFRPHRI